MRNGFAVVLAIAELTGCGTLLGQKAPESCGFPDGTALSFAGRSTTSALNVQQVVGDPLSDDPAYIYVTRDKFDQGELHGRLVCAIFVEQPSFVEVTVHPADGGRFEPSRPAEAVPAPSDGMSRTDAVDAARDALPNGEEWEVLVAEAGPLGHVVAMWEDYEWAGDVTADRWVWRVFLARDDSGAEVVMDFVDGSVYGVIKFIVN